MAKFCIAALLLLCFFTVSLARTSTTQEDNEATTTQVALPFPSETDLNSAVPFIETTFRPVNRRFRRPCRHHSKFYHKMIRKGDIAYGNDMILSSGENSEFEQPIDIRGRGNRIHGRWHHHHHHEDSDSDSDDEKDEDRVKKVVFRRHDNGKKLNKLREHFRVRNEAEKKEKGGFMRRVRKFLDHYF